MNLNSLLIKANTRVEPIPDASFKPCVVIPVFNHEHAIGTMVEAVLSHNLPCILVDDGSSLKCAQKLDELVTCASTKVAGNQYVKLVRLPVNSGKGAAMMAGFGFAANENFTHVIQIDADGQHCTDDLPLFLDKAKKNPETIIAGCPIYDSSVPKVRLYARYLTHICVWINTLSFSITDSMCGFRSYPIKPVMKLINHQKIGARMNFDTDILVRLYWQGVDVINVPTRVTYPSDGVSHFRLFMDNVLITRMHFTLFFGMLIRFPMLLARVLKRKPLIVE